MSDENTPRAENTLHIIVMKWILLSKNHGLFWRKSGGFVGKRRALKRRVFTTASLSKSYKMAHFRAFLRLRRTCCRKRGFLRCALFNKMIVVNI